jgi:transcriptional regulator GlxA family with amidase domain
MEAISDRRQARLAVIESRRRVVELAEAYQRAHLAAPVPVSRLCRIAGLSERGLRDAFYSIRGMSPMRCMLVERLQGVRKALRNSPTSSKTVTDAATEYGFYQLGRFAATYREAFGEAPSETLRGSRRLAAERTEHERASDGFAGV